MQAGRIAIAAVAMTLACAALPASAQQGAASNFTLCENADRQTDPRVALAACEALFENQQVMPARFAEVYLWRGAAHLQLGEHSEAIQDFSRTLMMNNAEARAHLLRATAYIQSGDNNAAFEDANAYVALVPDNAVGYALRAEIHTLWHRPDLAVADYNSAIQYSPTPSAALYYWRGKAHYENRAWEPALSDYLEAVRLAPEFADAHNRACWTRVANINRDIELARENCDAAVRLSNNHPSCLDSRALLALKQGRHQDAWNDYNAANLQTENAHFLYGRALAAHALGRAAEARADRARALSLQADIAQVYQLYGLAAFQ